MYVYNRQLKNYVHAMHTRTQFQVDYWAEANAARVHNATRSSAYECLLYESGTQGAIRESKGGKLDVDLS